MQVILTKSLVFKIKEIFYYLFIGAIILNYSLETISINNYNNSYIHDFFLVVWLGSISMCIFFQHYSCKKLLKLSVFSVVGILCYFSSGNTNLLITVLAICMLESIDFDRLLRFIFIEKIIIFLIVVTAALIGILQNSSIQVMKYTYTADGMTLGYSHPNMLAAEAGSIMLLFLCIHRHHLKIKYFIFFIVLDFILYNISKCRTACLIILIAVLLLIFMKSVRIRNIFMKLLPKMYILVLLLLTILILIYAHLGWGHPISHNINDMIFNGRIGLAYTSLVTYPVSLFGTNIDTSIWGIYTYYALDNGQVMLLLYYGIVGFLIYFLIIQENLKYIKKQNDYVLGVTFCVFLLWSMYEGTMYFIGKNFALLFLGMKNDLWNFKFANVIGRKNYDT